MTSAFYLSAFEWASTKATWGIVFFNRFCLFLQLHPYQVSSSIAYEYSGLGTILPLCGGVWPAVVVMGVNGRLPHKHLGLPPNARVFLEPKGCPG